MSATTKTTIYLDASDYRRLQVLAHAEGRPAAELVREAVAAYVAGPAKGKRPLPSFTGMYDSGHTDTSERVDELLWTDPHD